MIGIQSDVGMTLLQKSLDAAWQRQRATLNNIANNETPGYKTRRVEFERQLQSALRTGGTSPQRLVDSIGAVDPQIVRNNNTAVKADGNNVDGDVENIELARVQLHYKYLSSSLTSYIGRLKHVISEGKA